MAFHTKLLCVQNHLHIKFNKTNGFIKIYNGIRHLVLLGYWWYDKIFDNVKYLISEKKKKRYYR